MFLTIRRFPPLKPLLLRSLLVVLFGLTIVLRFFLYPIQTSDYTMFLSQWYNFIQTHGGFAALKYNFSNYNTPYLYLLAIATYLPIAQIVAIKSISVLFDMFLSVFTFLILRLRYPRSLLPTIGALVILLAPTLFINSAAWGQSDAIYTAFCLGSLYFLLKGRSFWACIFFGLALAFKLQAIFFAPVLLVLLLKRKLALRYLVFIPAIFLLMLLPAFIAGRDMPGLLSIYVAQVNNGGIGTNGQFTNGGQLSTNPRPGNGNPVQSGNGSELPTNNGYRQFTGGYGNFNGPTGGGNGRFSGGNGVLNGSSLTLNAPNLYQWFPADAPDIWKWIGTGLAALFVLIIALLVLRSKETITPTLILKIALVFALAIPFLLPDMHERYFYLADVLSIIFAFYFPRFFYIAIIMQCCSLLSYSPYFLQTQIVGLPYVAFAVLVIALIALVDLILTLYPNARALLRERLITPEAMNEGTSVKNPAL